MCWLVRVPMYLAGAHRYESGAAVLVRMKDRRSVHTLNGALAPLAERLLQELVEKALAVLQEPLRQADRI